MRRRADGPALVTGIVFTLLAGLGLWMAFGTVRWSAVGVALPAALVLLGVLGLALWSPRSHDK